MVSAKDLGTLATILRRDSLEATSASGSGHPSSCLSCADLMSCLFFSEMKYDPKKADLGANDVFILSKGHAAPILYAALKRAGCITHDLNRLRKIDSELEGHPVPPLGGWVSVATGSLGQGLSVGVGSAFGARMQKSASRVYVLLGDSECAEGSVWEAVELAGYYALSNLCAIIDVNSLGQRGKTMLGEDTKEFKKRFEAFGWTALVIDGHSHSEIISAFTQARKSSKPTVLIASTIKGKGVSFIEGQEGWHGRALTPDELSRAVVELPFEKIPKLSISKPKAHKPFARTLTEFTFQSYPLGSYVSTREAYGQTLSRLATTDSSIIALDAEVSNSTFSGLVKKTKPEQFVECFIAEQNMIGMALGLATRGFKPFASSFAAFLTRAHDQLRMAALSKASFTVCGSHSGVSIGEDGASQMGLEDIALFRTLPQSNVLCPSDALSTQKLTHHAAHLKGITYLRTMRAPTPVIYSSTESFPLGEFKVLHASERDSVTLIGAGITVHEALKAHILLKKEHISSAVIDLYSLKPLDAEKLKRFIREHGSRVVVIEDHYVEGGVGDVVAHALEGTGFTIKRIGVTGIPHSGTKDQLLAWAGIDVLGIVRATLSLTRPTVETSEASLSFKDLKPKKVSARALKKSKPSAQSKTKKKKR